MDARRGRGRNASGLLRLNALTLDHTTLPPFGVHAVRADRRHVSAKVRAMTDFLAARFAPRVWE